MKFLITRLFLVLAFFTFAFSANAQKERTIAEVQGDGNMSSFAGNAVRLKGIITARLRSGFFIQTPDADVDNNPKTSEGIYVYTGSEPTAEATIGNMVSVTGTVDEFRPKSAPDSLSITELKMDKKVDTIKVISSRNALPKPIILSLEDFASNDISQLEKYEGMRVESSSLTVVAPTGGRVDIKNNTSVSNGTFFAVLSGVPRPFRQPGMDVHDFFSSSEKDLMKKDHPKIALFDSNPEVLRIDSSEQLGAQNIDVTSSAVIKNLSGIMHYSYGKYTILPNVDTKATVSGFIKSSVLPELKENQFSLAGMNLENFFDDEDDPSIKEDIVTREAFEGRMKKISMAIRDYLRFPDIIGVTEAENLAGLKKLADKINADAVAAKQPNPKYEAYLIDGNDGRGIDVGYLVKSARVNVVKVEQIGKDEKFKNPKDKDEDILNDRPPLMIQVTINDPRNGKQFALTVITNHLKSFLGYNDPKDGGLRVRTKKKLQAEFLAKVVQERQKANADEKIVLLGDFNAYQFNDGITDIIGAIKGTPASKEEVLMASDDLVNPDLIDLVDLIQANQRYSYSFDGNAQVLDHALINQPMRKYLEGFGYARLNADFPEIYRNDQTRVERFSDHDAAIAYFTFDEKK
jgi:predicted extracellular nuclease